MKTHRSSANSGENVESTTEKSRTAYITTGESPLNPHATKYVSCLMNYSKCTPVWKSPRITPRLCKD